MPTFKMLQSNNDLQEIIYSAFDIKLDIAGSWGYTQALSTIVLGTESPLVQFEHMFASMRAYIEMNMTQEKEERYGSINLNEIAREQINKDNLCYDKVTYTLTAMKEDVYTAFIDAYKEGYEKDDFDLSEHFQQRKEATLTREVIHWFEIHSVLQNK